MTRASMMLCAISLSLLAGCALPLPAPRAQAPAALLTPLAPRATLAAAPAAAEDLRVMSFNLRVPFHLDLFNYWSHRKELLVETIERFSPDVLGTQECVTEQAEYLLARLPGYGFVGAGRDDGETDGEMTAIFYRRDRFRLLDSGHFWLSETPEEIGSKGWDAGWRRMCSWAKLESRQDGRVFVLFNTHFDAIGDEARYQSALLLRKRMQRIAGPLPALVTGDFNCAEDSQPYRALLAGAQRGSELLIDTYREAFPVDGPREGTRHGFDGRAGDERIDWILTTAGFDTLGAGIDHSRDGWRYPSDHFPVVAVLRWNEDEAAARLVAYDRPDHSGIPAGG